MTTILAFVATAFVALFFGFFKGRTDGKKAAISEQQANDLKAIKTAKGIDDATDNLDEPHINAALDRWMRDKQR